MEESRIYGNVGENVWWGSVKGSDMGRTEHIRIFLNNLRWCWEISGVLVLPLDSVVFHCSVQMATFLVELLLPVYPLWFFPTPRLAVETYDTRLCGGGATLQAFWCHSQLGTRRAFTKVPAVLKAFDVTVPGLSFLTPFSVGLWKTYGLLPFTCIILKVRLMQTAPSHRPLAIKIEQWCLLILSQTFFTSEDIHILVWPWN